MLYSELNRVRCFRRGQAFAGKFSKKMIRNQQVTRSSRVAGSRFPETIRDLSPSASSR
jgi:hypothetical protein